MAELHITTIDANHYQVQVVSSTTTNHNVTVQPDYAQKLSSGTMSTIDLIHKSFEFLLARESNTSILRSFDLSVIARYFPEYEREMSK